MKVSPMATDSTRKHGKPQLRSFNQRATVQTQMILEPGYALELRARLAGADLDFRARGTNPTGAALLVLDELIQALAQTAIVCPPKPTTAREDGHE